MIGRDALSWQSVSNESPQGRPPTLLIGRDALSWRPVSNQKPLQNLYPIHETNHAAPSNTSTSSGLMLAAGPGSGRLMIAAAALVALPPILNANTEL
jgi:hypothetical protein